MISWQKFGAYLCERGLLTEGQWKTVEGISARSGETPFVVLMAHNMLHEVDVSRSLAAYLGWEFSFMKDLPVEKEWLGGNDFAFYFELGAVPVCQRNGKVTIATFLPSSTQTAWAAMTFAQNYEFVLCTEKDFSERLQGLYAKEITDLAVEGLYRQSPVNSAKKVMMPGQAVIALAMAAAYGLLLIASWKEAVLAVYLFVNVFYAVTLLFRVILTGMGVADPIETAIKPEELKALDQTRLPTYSIMVAMYKEAEILPVLAHYLRDIDYPREKLQILLLLEADDTETIAAAKSLALESIFQIVVVPTSHPKTKPKALNYALRLCRGEYVTIYDAEDRPERDQLKKVISAFRKLPAEVSCIQARLNFFNREENFLTRMFTLEYSLWFDYLLSGLYKLRMPIPLGGTSNHFKTTVIKKLCGWDPYNVTEDADLGIRLEKYKCSVATLDSTTYEEANSELGNWIRQRSRWIKGHLQTWLVHMREPLKLLRSIGFTGMIGFNLFLGGPVLMVLLNPFLLAFGAFWIAVPEHPVVQQMPYWVVAISTFNLVSGNLMYAILGFIAAFKRKAYFLIPWALLLPIYWVLHSIAGMKAIYQLAVNPHFWEKTKHGISKVGLRERDDIVRSFKQLRPLQRAAKTGDANAKKKKVVNG